MTEPGWCDSVRPHAPHGIVWDSGQQAWCPGIPGWAAVLGLPAEAESQGVEAPFGCPHLHEIGALRSRTEALGAQTAILQREAEWLARINDLLVRRHKGDADV